ncbi:hypothetical protein [Mycoplasmoides gallisepticum]|nr:hypothetical protein [Mycoplasmoides gallisepticum]
MFFNLKSLINYFWINCKNERNLLFSEEEEEEEEEEVLGFGAGLISEN